MISLLEQLKAYKGFLTGDSFASKTGAIFCRVAGVSFDNRQEPISKMSGSTLVRLERDRRNPYDFNAVKVVAFVDNTWQDIGFVPASINKKVVQMLDNNISLKAFVWKIIGGGDYNLGVSIVIEKED